MSDFKHIVGKCRTGEEAVIRLFCGIDSWTASSFIGEFLYLESMKPSKIKVLINCEGGSVMYGMSIFSVIANSTVETECVIEGIAASMGSVIWTAGKRSLMRDYGILMIHNPFMDDDDEEEDMISKGAAKCKPKCEEGMEEEDDDDDDDDDDEDMNDPDGKCKPKGKCKTKNKCKTKDKCGDSEDACDPEDKCGDGKDKCGDGKDKCGDGEDKCGDGKDACDPKDACKKTKNESDAQKKEVIKAFRQQIETIYQRRLGLSKKKVQEIMEGEKGKDGTFFTAQEAVDAGIIPASNVIYTDKQKTSRVKNAIKGLEDAHKIRMSIDTICDEFCQEIASEGKNKHLENDASTLNKQELSQINNAMKDMNFNYGAVTAYLGMKEDVEVAAVMDRIKELVKTENLLKEAQNTINTLTTEKAGEVAKNENLTKELSEVKDALEVYKKAEKEAFDAKVTALVENAIKTGRIAENAKDSWIGMAQANFELAEQTLNSIPARKTISKEISNDPKNLENAKQATLDEVQAKIMQVVGKDFAYKKFE